MKNLIFVFILAVFVLGTDGKCNNYMLLDYSPTCGIAADCYFYGENYSLADNQNCRRKEKGLPPFLKRKPGKCPTDKPPCEYIVDKF
ncbi:accessory gland protein Acp63F-like isoform X3 [Drosophila ficusphila]|uniref:accessory gland protein Acp63F-like isoform X3 n=1 Tax=Drosophila ficusphila TaxID=30025 RepID=UPI0007E7B4E8|nr:accessory gland protein Acp63F-like isoform X3 [Drosophila ficusphila]